jgi:hypothetical protein
MTNCICGSKDIGVWGHRPGCRAYRADANQMHTQVSVVHGDDLIQLCDYASDVDGRCLGCGNKGGGHCEACAIYPGNTVHGDHVT